MSAFIFSDRWQKCHALELEELEDEQVQVLDLGMFGEHQRLERLDVEPECVRSENETPPKFARRSLRQTSPRPY
jgi:hypothetical protein